MEKNTYLPVPELDEDGEVDGKLDSMLQDRLPGIVLRSSFNE